MLYENYGVTNIKFVDDSFLEPPRDALWAARFADMILRTGIPLRFRTQVRADRLDAGIVRALRSAGWFATSIGIENAAPTALKRMGKCATVDDNLRALELLHENDIYVQVGMILFDEATTMPELELNYNFLLSHPWVVTKGIFTEMFAAEGTPFTRKLQRKGITGTGERQNHKYQVGDSQARRVHRLLKVWHASHSMLYDWVMDSISAPKVLPEEGYIAVHALCMEMAALDVQMFRKVLDHVEYDDESADDAFVHGEIDSYSRVYMRIRSQIERIYERYGLVYDGIPNPFLTQ